jgi:hypothetical protein
VCVTTQIVDGTACDGGACLVGAGECKAGACVGVPVDCDDGEPCTDDGCERGRGCVHAAVAQFSYCDKDPCRSEVCSHVGECYSPPNQSSTGKPCGDDYCDKAGSCVLAAAFALGVFGDACDNDNDCESGECVVGVDGDKVCSFQCYRGGGDCPDGWLCGTGPACHPSDYGKACSAHDDCAHRCAGATESAPGYCTAYCWDWSCPDGFTCEILPELSKETGITYCVSTGGR